MEKVHRPNNRLFGVKFKNRQIAGILASVKVDVVILGEMLEMVYEDLERQGESMTFENLDVARRAIYHICIIF